MQTTRVKSLSDEELLTRYQEADTEAFEEFFNRRKALVFNYLLSRLRNRSDAEEAFQKTFLKIHKYILKYDPSQSALGWVMTIARNVSIDVNGKVVSSSDSKTSEELSTTESSGLLEARSALSHLVNHLSPKDRELLERRFLTEDSFEDIASDEGWTVENTRQRVSRLIRRLRAQVLHPGRG